MTTNSRLPQADYHNLVGLIRADSYFPQFPWKLVINWRGICLYGHYGVQHGQSGSVQETQKNYTGKMQGHRKHTKKCTRSAHSTWQVLSTNIFMNYWKEKSLALYSHPQQTRLSQAIDNSKSVPSQAWQWPEPTLTAYIQRNMAWGSASLIDSHTGVITRIQVLSFSDLQSSQQRVDEKESGWSKLKITWRGAKRSHEAFGAVKHKRELPTSWQNQLIRFVILNLPHWQGIQRK